MGGSGIVESANKLVVEARLNGAGMHWVEVNVDPMLALRCTISGTRWEKVWPQISRHLPQASRRSRPRPRLPMLPSSPAPRPIKRLIPQFLGCKRFRIPKGRVDD